MINQLKHWIIILISVFMFSCKGSQKTMTPRNLERIYNPASSTLHPEIKVYNISDSTSLFVERIYCKDLLYNQANVENKLLARVKVIYNLYDINNKQNLVDSASTTFKFEKNTNILYHTLEIPVKTSVGNSYILEVITSDINRNNSQYSFRIIDRLNQINPQDFIVTNILNNELLTNSLINEKAQFSIKHYKEDFDFFTIYYYSNNFKTPDPPYMNDSVYDEFELADTNWICYVDSIHYSDFQNEGVYYFKTKTATLELSEGFALYNFGEGFPVVRTPVDLAKPLKYLRAIDSVQISDSTGKLTKLAVDKFWLSKATNIDKARELLKFYYNRVMFANMYFTSYKEGWQTDRGMIYIIYGLPDYLFKSGEEERWIYNPVGVGPGISFTFKFIKTPFSSNHYRLDREKLKTTGWDEAIKMWNNGEILYFQN